MYLYKKNPKIHTVEQTKKHIFHDMIAIFSCSLIYYFSLSCLVFSLCADLLESFHPILRSLFTPRLFQAREVGDGSLSQAREDGVRGVGWSGGVLESGLPPKSTCF